MKRYVNFNIFSNISMRKEFQVLLGVPTLALLLVSAYETQTLKLAFENTQRFESLANFSHVANELVHELQKERGASAGYIGSQGKNSAAFFPIKGC